MSAPGTARKAYHYVTSAQAKEIAAAGFILPTDACAKLPAKPVILFSRHVYLEPTACKAFIDGKWVFNLSPQDTRRLNGGLVRYGISADKLLTADQLRKAANIPWPVWLDMRRKGIEQHADPQLWMGSLEPIPLSALTIQKMDEVGSWSRVPPAPNTTATPISN